MENHFVGKKVLVMGLGLHGGGVSVVRWLLKNKAQVTITDLKISSELKFSLNKIKKLPGAKNIRYTLGRHEFEDFTNQDLIIQNPGVPTNSPYIKKAREFGIPIVNEAVMFFGRYAGKTIGVTGTRGKSTTASLLHHILKSPIKGNVLTGNIATTPFFDIVDKLKKNSWPVAELSSWHLELMDEYKISPAIGVVTNVLRDHLNRYSSFRDYQLAKFAIIKHQSKSDIAVLNADNIISKNFAKHTKSKVYFFSLKKKVKGAYLEDKHIYFFDGQKNILVMPTDRIRLLGRHNLANILAAVTVAKVLRISNDKIKKAVNSFRGIDYRLEYKGKVRGRDIYNDSTATSPDATLAAINALGSRSIVLIAGGVNKDLDYALLAKKIKSKVKFLALLSGTGSDSLLTELKKIKYPTDKYQANINKLPVAWALSLKKSSVGDVIVLSPGGASFNMFINEFDRARQFDKLIHDSQKAKK